MRLVLRVLSRVLIQSGIAADRWGGTTGDFGIITAACCSDQAEAGHAIGEHCEPRSQVLPGPVAEHLQAEPSHRHSLGVNRVTCLAEESTFKDGNLVH